MKFLKLAGVLLTAALTHTVSADQGNFSTNDVKVRGRIIIGNPGRRAYRPIRPVRPIYSGAKVCTARNNRGQYFTARGRNANYVIINRSMKQCQRASRSPWSCRSLGCRRI